MVIATIVINVIAALLLAFAPWSDWRTGAALLFGVVVGLTELVAYAWLVDYRRTIIPLAAVR